ncbi:MAG: NADH-quinone oxidoreductase subunit NuoF [Oscillospiraceae bacterium]|nr:NADH-quinone oxidoreductase subunit NuoF [Oscillospiraceae bacterium]
MSHIRSHVMVCSGTGCSSTNSAAVLTAFEREIKKHKLQDEVKVVKTGCLGLCNQGPNVMIFPEGACYAHVTEENVTEIVEEHLIKGRIVSRLLLKEDAGPAATSLTETQFYRHQLRIALRNCGVINPESIDEYLGVDGYTALERILTEKTDPQEIIDCIKKSGLRGRGGAGFSTGMKWQFTHDATSEDGVKYVCCNADEGDPGAFMDRSVLEGDPFSVIEAMTIAGYAVGASQGYIYVRAEYPIAVKRLELAIGQARKYGLLGKNILGTDFSFDLELRLGAGAFVCGEETALLISIEGKRGEPRPRPPFPASKGLLGKPTLLNNVETYANITWILNNGWEKFAAIGTEKSKGTKVFALGGKITNTGLVEIPMGTTLRTIIEDIGGGIPGGKKFKAAQTGGPSGGCIPAELIDTPIDYDSLTAIGSMMGSGGLIVMDEDNCMVDIAKFFLQFCVDESCGKCVPCRIGTKRLYDLLDKITKGQGTLEDLDTIEELCYHLKDSALCALGQSAPNPVLSTLRYFRDEYVAHVVEKRCPAGVCRDLLRFEIDPTKCKGCTLCARNCPVNAISGAIKAPHVIDHDKCIHCGLCQSNCRFDAITKA